MDKTSSLLVRPATADDWTAVEALFGRGGGSNGCWCQYWLLGADYHRRDRGENRDDLHRQVTEGTTGLLAFADGAPVGWARLSPRSSLRWLTTRYRSYRFADDDPWTLSCFVVSSSWRRNGVMRALISGAAEWADDHDVPLEAYPVDPEVPQATRNRFTGVLQPFLTSGFVECGRLSPDRPVVRRGRPAERGRA
ncbi:GNAT family N-acetyltransferase [Arthrobacter sp. NPDC090010]|uniref:GNAT family N-acetyltransferase n=1 Tax=Arthrobacter sp. NPDC090010 TaxID=3363942 RepID=UPI0038113261